MTEIDKRGKLEDEVFTYRVTKQGQIFIAWHGKTVTTLSGKEAEKFLTRIAGCDDLGSQLVMAKATGNFKRGNERR